MSINGIHNLVVDAEQGKINETARRFGEQFRAADDADDRAALRDTRALWVEFRNTLSGDARFAAVRAYYKGYDGKS